VNRTTVAAIVGLVAIAGAADPASAKPRKPIKKTYSVTAASPDPTNYTGAVPGSGGYSVCAQRVPGSYDKKAFKAPAAGKLSVTLDNYLGDWDLLITDKNGNELTAGGASDVGTPTKNVPESAVVKFKKAGTANIIACNWAGGSTGRVSYTFTYA
jgi:hypothetical protein